MTTPAPPPTAELVEALAPLFADSAAVSNAQLAAIAAALDEPNAAPLLSACCRAIALRSLITAASQSNNAEAARRAAMTLLERFTDDEPEQDAPLSLDHPDVIAHTRALLEQDEPSA